MTERGPSLGRREVLWATGSLAALAPAIIPARAGEAAQSCIAAQTQWSEPPAQRPVEAGPRQLGYARLFAWDTGGAGEAIVFLHPMTGSHAVWPYQQPVFADAGYRVIGYSRRGFFQSDPRPADGGADDADDLRALLDHLGIARAHLVASAAGGFLGLEFTRRFPGRVLTLVLASTMALAGDPVLRSMRNRLVPEGWDALPAEFRELGPSYRAANPAGVRRWMALERQARHGPHPARGATGASPALDPATLPRLLCLTGDADLYAPPALMRACASRIRGAELAVVAEAGHALFWEQPDAFNRTVLSFLRRGTAAAAP